MGIFTSASTENVSNVDRKAVAALEKVHYAKAPAQDLGESPSRLFPTRQPSIARQQASLNEAPVDLSAPIEASVNGEAEQPKTILYLAYGSNLAAETFLVKRAIRPMSQVNVVVPELVMTFDLAGLPYVEPCQ